MIKSCNIKSDNLLVPVSKSYYRSRHFFSFIFLLIIVNIYKYSLAQTTTINYNYDGSNFCNPERGFYKYSQNNFPLSAASLSSYRAMGYTLVYRIYYIDKSLPLSSTFLSDFQTDMQTLRNGGMKCVLRFAYTSTDANDAPITTVLAHLDQLQPYLQSNYDVIAILQQGFIGTWGEGYYTNNFGDQGVISATDWTNRTNLLLKELSILPTDRMVAIRVPWQKKTLLGRTTPITAAEAYTGTNWARVGFHDDAFMANDQDWGTFPNGQPDRDWLNIESQYLSTGGESESGDQTVNGCTNTLNQINYIHFSYVDRDYNSVTIDKWISEGCFSEIEKKMGYRFYLTNGTFTNLVKPGGIFSLNLNLINEGYAAPYNPRLVEIILKNKLDGKECKFPLPVEPRKWLPGNINITTTIGIPSNYADGTYDVFINFPDPVGSLYSNPNYSIRLANSGVWDPTNGYNDLGFDLVVNSSAGGTDYAGSQWFSLCYGALKMELVYFNAQVNNNIVFLNWGTEENSDKVNYFQVQSSADGMHFQTIGTVASNNQNHYSLDVPLIEDSMHYFRLVQVNQNGKTDVSTILAINKNKEEYINVYPNPSAGNLTVSIQGITEPITKIDIYNAEGILCYTAKETMFGNSSLSTIDVSSLPSGLYYIRIKTSHATSTKKFCIVKETDN